MVRLKAELCGAHPPYQDRMYERNGKEGCEGNENEEIGVQGQNMALTNS